MYLNWFLCNSLALLPSARQHSSWHNFHSVFNWLLTNYLHLSSKQDERRKESSEQETRHSNVVCGRAGIFHLLDTTVYHQYDCVVQSTNHLPNTWVHSYTILSTSRLFFILLQSNNVLLYESRLSQGVFEFVPMLQETTRAKKDEHRWWWRPSNRTKQWC